MVALLNLLVVIALFAAKRAPRRELLSLVDFAAECGVNPITIRRMIASGDLPAYRVGRRGILKIDARDVDLVVRRAKPEEVSA